jgi:hypothetical protein
MVMVRLISLLLVLASAFLVQGASAQTRPHDPDAPYVTPKPDLKPIPGWVIPVQPPVEVPPVIGMDYSPAALKLRQRGLMPVANRTDGIVREQSEPAGKMVPRGTRVTLRVVPPPPPTPPPPTPLPKVEVPPVIGMDYSPAALKLRQKGLMPVANRTDGIVREQSEPAGKMVPRGTRVTLRVVPPPPPTPPPIWPMVILIGGLGGAAVYVIYKLKTRPKPQFPPPKPRFEAEEGDATQEVVEIVADKAILDMALSLKVVKDAGKQELKAEEPIIPVKGERHE